MQKIQIQLTKPLDESSIVDQWEEFRILNSGPRVDFEFNGKTLMAVLHTSGAALWPVDNFRRSLQLVLHQVDPDCDIRDVLSIAA